MDVFIEWQRQPTQVNPKLDTTKGNEKKSNPGNAGDSVSNVATNKFERKAWNMNCGQLGSDGRNVDKK